MYAFCNSEYYSRLHGIHLEVYHLMKYMYMLLSYIHKLIGSKIKKYFLKFCSVLKETNWKARSAEIEGIKHEIVLSIMSYSELLLL